MNKKISYLLFFAYITQLQTAPIPYATKLLQLLKTKAAQSSVSTTATTVSKSGDGPQELLSQGRLSDFLTHRATLTALTAAGLSTYATDHIVNSKQFVQTIGRIPQIPHSRLRFLPSFVLSLAIGAVTFNATHTSITALESELFDSQNESKE
jgi:hypothetical protein